MKADASSWKIQPFTEGVVVPCHFEVTKDQLESISEGLIPKDMDEKWFIYFESPYLYVHRSWTGQPVCRLQFNEQNSEYYVSEMLVPANMGENLEYWGEVAIYLVRRSLLGEDIPFPEPPKGVLGKKR